MVEGSEKKIMKEKGFPSVPHPPQFNTSVSHKRASSFQSTKFLSPPKTPQFTTPLNYTPKPLISTPKTPRFNIKNLSVPLLKPLSSILKTLREKVC